MPPANECSKYFYSSAVLPSTLPVNDGVYVIEAYVYAIHV